MTDINGKPLFTSTPVSTALSINSTLTTVDLGTFSTTGLANGQDTITVTAVDQSSQPLPTATGQGSLLVGLPFSATLSVSQSILPTGSPTATSSVEIDNNTSEVPNALTLDGAVQTTPATTVALYSDATHDLAYVCGPNGIDIVDVSNPAAPVDDGTFGTAQIVQGGLTVGRVDTIGGTQYLIVGSTVAGTQHNIPPFTLLIYSLANPLSPSLVSETAFQYGYLSDMVVEGNTVLVSVYSYFLMFGFQFDGQEGNVMSINVSNPAAPTLNTVLFSSTDANAGTTQFGVTIVNSQIAYVASSTNSGGSTQDGEGRVVVVNYSNPTDFTYSEVDIPGTYQILTVAVEGDQALVVGRTGGDASDDNNGTMTFSVLDITNPANPTVVGTTLDSLGQIVATSAVTKISATPLGNGLFAVSEATVNASPDLLVVDPADPSNILVAYIPVTSLVNEMAVSGNLLYTSSAQGLAIYTIGSVVSIPLTVSVEVPNNTGVAIVAGSYSTAPTSITTGTTFNTLVWTENWTFGDPVFPITWQATVSNLARERSGP